MNAPIIMKAESLPRRHPRERPDGSLTHCHPPSQPTSPPACCSILLSGAPPTSLPPSLSHSFSVFSLPGAECDTRPSSLVLTSVRLWAAQRAGGRPNSLTDSRKGSIKRPSFAVTSLLSLPSSFRSEWQVHFPPSMNASLPSRSLTLPSLPPSTHSFTHSLTPSSLAHPHPSSVEWGARPPLSLALSLAAASAAAAAKSPATRAASSRPFILGDESPNRTAIISRKRPRLLFDIRQRFHKQFVVEIPPPSLSPLSV